MVGIQNTCLHILLSASSVLIDTPVVSSPVISVELISQAKSSPSPVKQPAISKCYGYSVGILLVQVVITYHTSKCTCPIVQVEVLMRCEYL